MYEIGFCVHEIKFKTYTTYSWFADEKEQKKIIGYFFENNAEDVMRKLYIWVNKLLFCKLGCTDLFSLKTTDLKYIDY